MTDDQLFTLELQLMRGEQPSIETLRKVVRGYRDALDDIADLEEQVRIAGRDE